MGKVSSWTGRRMAVLGVLLGVVFAVAAAQAQAVAIRELQLPLVGTRTPNHITAGAEGNLWLTGHNLASIDRITPEGDLTEFFLTPNSSPEGIALGPDGELWFTEPGWNRIGRLSSAGALTEFESNGITGQTAGIVLGPEGTMWFSQNDGAVGRITTAGSVTEFSAGVSQSAHGIALGPDGNLWFAEGSKIGRITPNGAVTEFSETMNPDSEAWSIALGPDGNMWFTERGTDRIGRITPNGVVTEFSEGITPGSEPLEIAAGPDGNLWFTERAGARVGRITPSGVVTEFSQGITPGSAPSGIAAGPEDSMWFTEEAGRIGQVMLSAAAAPTAVTEAAASVTPTSATLNATANPEGQTVSDCHFDYGTSEAYGSSVPCSHLPGAGSSPVAVVASVGNLSENTTYHVRIVATNSGGTSYGADQTFTTATAAKSSPMWIGVDAAAWSSSNAPDVAGAVSYARLDTPSRIAGWTAAGVKVINDMSGPYSEGGVSAVNASQWAQQAVAWYDANPECVAIEVLNEPGNRGFWGPNAGDQQNATAYAHLLKVVHEAFVANGKRPLLLASYDGGEGPTTWGEETFKADPNVGGYIDGITMHSYGGTDSRAASALGRREHIEAAHAQHPNIPIYVTEVGWPTAVGQPSTGDSLQWTEAEQAANIYAFVGWARSTGYIADVTIFNYRDYGTNNWYGIESATGSRKLSYTALHQAATEQPLNIPLP